MGFNKLDAAIKVGDQGTTKPMLTLPCTFDFFQLPIKQYQIGDDLVTGAVITLDTTAITPPVDFGLFKSISLALQYAVGQSSYVPRFWLVNPATQECKLIMPSTFQIPPGESGTGSAFFSQVVEMIPSRSTKLLFYGEQNSLQQVSAHGTLNVNNFRISDI